MDVSKLFLGRQEFNEEEPKNPCDYGRWVWDRMNGNALRQNKNLRIMCMGLMASLAVSTVGNVYQATQSTVEPYIIEVGSTPRSCSSFTTSSLGSGFNWRSRM